MCGYLPATEKGVTIGSTAQPFIGPNPRRHSLILFIPSGNRVTISQRSDVALNNGITISNSTSPFIMRVDDFGDWICRQLFAIGDAAGIVAGYVEVTDLKEPIPTMDFNNYQNKDVRYNNYARKGSVSQ